MPTTRGGRLTIGALAKQAGISAQTLRHYDRLGLLRPASTSDGGYRLYTEQDRARLELIRALRGLDLDLGTIAQLLRGAVHLRRVAELHLQTLDLQARTLERRRAVLRVLLRSEKTPTAERLAQLQALAGFERMEREQFLGEQLGERMRGTSNGTLQRWIQTAAVVDLPESPTEAQVEAWLELAEMVSDPAFLARHRAGGPSPAVHRSASGVEPAAWPRLMNAIYGPAAKAAAAGVDPRSARAQRILRRWLGAIAGADIRDLRSFAEQMLRAIDGNRDMREERFWQLVGILKPHLARSPISVAWPWLMTALRAWLEG